MKYVPITQNDAIRTHWLGIWEERFAKRWRVTWERTGKKGGHPRIRYYPVQAREPLYIPGGFKP